MSSFGVVAFSKVQRLLSECAPGSELILKAHLYWVRYNGLTYRGLPKGGHGKNEVKVGTIEQMVKYLGIDRKCSKKQMPALTLKEEAKPLESPVSPTENPPELDQYGEQR